MAKYQEICHKNGSGADALYVYAKISYYDVGVSLEDFWIYMGLVVFTGRGFKFYCQE